MRIKAGPHTRKRHKRLLKLAEGFTSRRKNNIRWAREQVMRKLKHAYKHRRRRAGDMRALWITRINAAVRGVDTDYSYSKFVDGLKRANIAIDRKSLAELATNNGEEFGRLVQIAKQHAA